MLNKKILLGIIIFCTVVVSGQININGTSSSQGIINIQTPPSPSFSGGGNVTSVSSGDNCIFVSPTTGDVQITFNTSCGGSGSGDGSFNITYQTFAYNQTTPALNYVRTYYYNKTEINSFNASWISTFNITYQTWAYNQTTAVFNTVLLNNTIAQYGNLIGFNSTYNATYAQFAYNQTYNNNTGSVNRSICWQNDCTGFRNPFNQNLNTTNSPTFNGGTFNADVTFNNNGGGALPITQLLLGTVNIGGGLISLPAISMGGISAGIQVGSMLNGLYLIPSASTISSQLFLSRNPDVTDAWTIQNNNNTGDLEFSRSNPFAGPLNGNIRITGNTFVSGNSSIKGTNHDWAVPNGFINATGVNITSNHQILYPNYSLDTTYKNDYGRPMILTMGVQFVYNSIDDNYLIINKTSEYNSPSNPTCTMGKINHGFVGEDYDSLNCPISAGESFSINTYSSGTSTISILKSSIMLI